VSLPAGTTPQSEGHLNEQRDEGNDMTQLNGARTGLVAIQFAHASSLTKTSEGVGDGKV
jgi:hypothetical protein